ncbi:MAG: LPXTG cell wall anchor domain-containing protein [Clostridia bacterium]
MKNKIKKLGCLIFSLSFLSITTFANETSLVTNVSTGDSNKTILFVALGFAIVAIIGVIIYSTVSKNKK